MRHLFLLVSLFVNLQLLANDYHKSEYMIPMRDSVHIYTAVYAPAAITEFTPIIMVRTPYGCSPYGPENFTKDLKSGLKPYVERGYIIVLQDVRGRNKSEGDFENVRPLVQAPSESLDARDVYDTIEWLQREKGYTGNVGLKGISYPGYYALVAGFCGHEALKAVSPQAPVSDWFIGDDFHHNGATMILDASRFGRGFLRVRKTYDQKFPKLGPLFEGSSYDYFLERRTLAAVGEDMGADSLAFWCAMREHPNYDSFWQERSTIKALEACGNYAPAVLIMGGTYDAEDCYGIFATYRAISRYCPSTPLHLVIGPFSHGGWRSDKAYALGGVWMSDRAHKEMINVYEAAFFDHYLQGMYEAPAAVRYVEDGPRYNWKTASCWPPVGCTSQTIHLLGTGLCRGEASYISDPFNPVPFVENPVDRKADYMVSDQSFARSREDVLTFDSQELTEDVTVCGPITVNLSAAISGADCDFVVKVIDVYPDDFSYSAHETKMIRRTGAEPAGPGYNQLVRGNVYRGRYKSGFSTPSFFKKNAPTNVSFTLEDVCHTFKAGHKICIQVQSSWFPLVDMNPQTAVENIYYAEPSDFEPCTVNIYLNKKGVRSSSLTFCVSEGTLPSQVYLVK